MLDSRLAPWLLQVAGLLAGQAAGLAGLAGRRQGPAAPTEISPLIQAGFLASQDFYGFTYTFNVFHRLVMISMDV